MPAAVPLAQWINRRIGGEVEAFTVKGIEFCSAAKRAASLAYRVLGQERGKIWGLTRLVTSENAVITTDAKVMCFLLLLLLRILSVAFAVPA